MKPFFASLTSLMSVLVMSARLGAQPPPPPPPQSPPPPPYPPPAYAPPPYSAPGYPPPAYYYPQGAYRPLPYVRRSTEHMDPDDPPPGYHTESRTRSGLVIGGAVMLGITYFISASAAAGGLSDRSDNLVPLFVPLAGP